MRFKLLLITMLFIPYVVKGQESVVFYSSGKIYVGQGVDSQGTASPSNTSLYVSGSMTFASTSSDVAKKTTVVQEGRTTLTGDLINALDPNHGENNLFTAGGNGELEFSNKTNGSTLTFSNAKAGGVSISNTKEWKLNTVQRIRSAYNIEASSDMERIQEQKRKNFLNINKIIVPATITGNTATANYLTIDPSAAVKIQALDVEKGGFFEIGTTTTGADDRMYLHTGFVKFGSQPSKAAYASNDIFNTNFVHRVTLTTPEGSHVHRDGSGYYLTGFTPLFKGLMADYMFFNTLTEPGNGSITSWKGTITDPTSMMNAGKGYFMAQTDFQADYQEILNNHFGGVTLGGGTDLFSGNRAKHEYVFNRTLMEKDVAGGGQQMFNKKSTADDTFNPSEEIFNATDVKVKLKAGFNYLGNPFTAPLDLRDIVTVPAETTKELANFGITVSGKTAGANTKDIRNKYWVINKAIVNQAATNGWYEYTLSYYDAQAAGGTLINQGNLDGEYYVAPMQMFLLQGGNLCTNATTQLPDCEITLPYNATGLGGSPIAPRSVSVNDAETERADEFVLEAVDLDALTQDRLSVVLRDNASLMDTDPTDTHKALKSQENGRWFPTMNGTIYTRSSNDRPMLTNTVPTSAKQLAMYITPPSDKTRNMMIQPYRMETMSTVSRVWLEDKFENKIIELTPETKYYFSSPVLTEQEASKNRFVIHFAPVDNNDLIVNEDPIACYYNSSTLYISGLNEKDLNSNVQIYDLQGRMIGKTIVNSTGRMEYLKPLTQGTYIVKITGKRNYTTKFVNLQN